MLPEARSWNTVPADHARAYACSGYAGPGAELYLRAVDVAASPTTVFRWLCQLRVAPYSYDLIDNLGRRSPRTLTAGLDELAVGQRFAVVARIVAFERGRHITAVTSPRAGRRKGPVGPVGLTYDVRATPAGSRLVGAMAVGAGTPVQRAARTALGWGDLVMMRKQLLTLRELAESS